MGPPNFYGILLNGSAMTLSSYAMARVEQVESRFNERSSGMGLV